MPAKEYPLQYPSIVLRSVSDIQGVNAQLQSLSEAFMKMRGTAGDIFNDHATLINASSGSAIPAGGSTNQALAKVSGTDYDTAWVTIDNAFVGSEPAFSKNSGFNLVLGMSGGTVSEGDHLHSGVYEPADATILKDADIGVSVQGWDTDLDAYAATPLNTAELQQLQNIGITTISTAQWGYVGNLNQSLTTTSNVNFNIGDFSDAVFVNGATQFNNEELSVLGRVYIRVGSSLSTTPDASANAFVLEASFDTGMSILTPNTVAGRIYFGDPEGPRVGRIIYNHADNTLNIWTNNTQRLALGTSAIFTVPVSTTDTTDSTSTTTGAIRSDGGIGSVKNIIGGQLIKSGAGATGSRPTPQGAGSMWFDETLGIPIWHDSTNWIDATGATV